MTTPLADLFPPATTPLRSRANRTPSRVPPCVPPLVLFVLALTVRLWHLRSESLWLDEGYTLLFSRMHFPQLILVGGAHEHPPLYYIVVHALLALHDSPFVPRYVSAVAGALCIVAVYLLGERLMNRAAGTIAGLFALISPFQVWYSQDGRAYELASLFVLLSYLLAWRCREQPSRAAVVGYGLTTALALYTEYTVLFVLVPQILLLHSARRPSRRALVTGAIIAALLFVPWVGTVALDAKSIAGSYWIPPPSADAVASTWLQFLLVRTPCPSPPCTGSQVPLPFLAGNEVLIVAIIIALIAATGLTAWMKGRLVPLMLSAWALTPFILVLIIATKWSLYLDRVFLDASFAVYLLLGGLISLTLRRTWSLVPGAALGLGLLAVAGGANVLMWQNAVNPDWKTPARDLAAAWRPGEGVAYVPGVLAQVVTAYTPSRWRHRHTLTLWYHAYLDVPGWQRFATLTDDQLRSRQLARFARGRTRVWLVSEDYVGLNDTRRWFETHGFYCALSQIYTGDTRIELWSRLSVPTIGPTALPWSSTGWSTEGTVTTTAIALTERGTASAQRSFDLRPEHAYSVNVNYLGMPPANPAINVQVYDARGNLISGYVDRFGRYLTGYPRTEWYDLPADGAWLSEPFGFISPPGAARATITLSNGWGTSEWRNIAVYMSR